MMRFVKKTAELNLNLLQAKAKKSGHVQFIYF